MNPEETRYDAIVIGSGQGGSPLAQDLAAKGWRVALVERRHVGGTCINTGCTPTKTMVASAQVAHYARHAARWGVRTGRKLKIGKIPMSYVARAIERDETAGFMKLVVDAETNRILGAAILGSEGGELVQMLGALMLAGAPYTLLKGAVYIHPTLAEGFYSLMDAVAPAD